MLLLTKNNVNTVVLTLNEKKTLASPFYLFSFLHVDSNTTTNFLPVAISATTRFNEFQITETASTLSNLTGGTVNLNESFYEYKIYEQTGNTNTGITNTTGSILEEGIAFVSGSTFPTQVEYEGQNLENAVYYGG